MATAWTDNVGKLIPHLELVDMLFLVQRSQAKASVGVGLSKSVTRLHDIPRGGSAGSAARGTQVHESSASPSRQALQHLPNHGYSKQSAVS